MDANATPDDFAITLANTLTGVAEATRLITERLSEWSVGDRARYIVELALEEVLTNIVRCAYPDNVVGSIDVRLRRRSGSLVLAFEDTGTPFDPTQRDASRAGGSLETATIGGRGILMMRNLTQSMRYERHDGRNRLELVIGDDPPSPAPSAPAATGP